MGTPKLPRRFNGLEADSVAIDKDLSGHCEVFLDSIKTRVEELERAERRLGTIHATLIVNFNAEGQAGKKAGVVLENTALDTLTLLLTVLEKLCTRIEDLEKSRH